MLKGDFSSINFKRCFNNSVGSSKSTVSSVSILQMSLIMPSYKSSEVNSFIHKLSTQVAISSRTNVFLIESRKEIFTSFFTIVSTTTSGACWVTGVTSCAKKAEEESNSK